jgi:CO/xanthine dehydrogenase FAD-binding subunit
MAVAGAGRRAFRAGAVEAAICGKSLDYRGISEAAEFAANGVELVGDRTAGPQYRALLVRTLVKRALISATAALH